MPIVRIDLIAGRTPERKAELVRQVTAAVVETLEVRPDQVRVLLNEVPPEHWAVAGQSMAERARSEQGAEGLRQDVPPCLQASDVDPRTV